MKSSSSWYAMPFGRSEATAPLAEPWGSKIMVDDVWEAMAIVKVVLSNCL